MGYYLDITLLPSADIGHHFLWEKVFDQIHLGLVKMQDLGGKVPVGIALPEYNAEQNQLGYKLRLFAERESDLLDLDASGWSNRFSDYVHITRIREVPSNIKSYASFARQRPKSNIERLARRKAKREGIPYEEALKLLASLSEKRIKTPFINVQSRSSENRFPLFIIKIKKDQAANKGFNCYGLSQDSAVPDF